MKKIELILLCMLVCIILVGCTTVQLPEKKQPREKLEEKVSAFFDQGEMRFIGTTTASEDEFERKYYADLQRWEDETYEYLLDQDLGYLVRFWKKADSELTEKVAATEEERKVFSVKIFGWNLGDYMTEGAEVVFERAGHDISMHEYDGQVPTGLSASLSFDDEGRLLGGTFDVDIVEDKSEEDLLTLTEAYKKARRYVAKQEGKWAYQYKLVEERCRLVVHNGRYEWQVFMNDGDITVVVDAVTGECIRWYKVE
ncbi:MAG: hypothetical protein IJ315_03355, partial [Firmicutes bacterium]|nr:hypothetical protein [Bacillota bacterium]